MYLKDSAKYTHTKYILVILGHTDNRFPTMEITPLGLNVWFLDCVWWALKNP